MKEALLIISISIFGGIVIYYMGLFRLADRYPERKAKKIARYGGFLSSAFLFAGLVFQELYLG